ncbi:hypothetical protein ACLIBH_07885 [Virgibacillus sp. W0430]|uniref:hypothetical protein n=1 Tax=Virgibacillus sp. W0430 TaxID=3391580 RepID=UPI003F4701F2
MTGEQTIDCSAEHEEMKNTDEFYIPTLDCPQRLDGKKFPSANSCLPAEELEQLKERQRKANDLLLRLADINNEETENQGLRDAFENILDHHVTISLKMNEAPTKKGNKSLGGLKGKVVLAGRDFVILQSNNKEVAIPYTNVTKITLSHLRTDMSEGRELDCIDPILRRCLTFRFGKVVSGSLKLIQIFHGITLNILLLNLIDHTIKIVLEDESVVGEVFCVDKNSIEICIGNDLRKIPIHTIRYVITDPIITPSFSE